MRDRPAATDEHVFDGVFACAGDVRVTESGRELCDHAPVHLPGIEGGKLGTQDQLGSLRIRKFKTNDVVKPPEQRAIEKANMIGRRDNQAVGMILLDHLEEGADDAADFSNVVIEAALCAYAVEFVEEIDCSCLRNRIKDQTKFGSGRAHEFADQAIKVDDEQREAKLAG